MPGQVGREARRLGARELGRVGVLLLREHRRARGEGVVELDEAVLVARPLHDLGAEAREVHAELRREVQVVDQGVAAADRVEAVGAGTREAELGRRGLAVDREAHAREGARAERAVGRGRDRVPEAGAVAVEHPDVGEQVVRQAHRLRALAVRVAGQQRVEVGLGLGQQCLGQIARSSVICSVERSRR